MVLTSLIKNILPIAGVGLALAFLYNVVAKPGAASQSATALGQTLDAFGSGLGSVGAGAQSFLTGVGSGSAKLLDPLFSLKTLVYGDSTQEIVRRENQFTESNTTINDPVVNAASTQVMVSPDPAANTIGPEVQETPIAPRTNPIRPTGYVKDSLGPNRRLAAGYDGGVAAIGTLEYIFNTTQEPSNPAAINQPGGNSVVSSNIGSSIFQGPIYPDYSNPNYPSG